jgi:FSR family fosmidomycin resistance protein-like MFS transporter
MYTKFKLGLLGTGHLLIDMIGIYTVNYQFRHLSISYVVFFFIIYNLIAFGIQPVIGYYTDTKNRYKEVMLLGLILGVLGLTIINLGLLALLCVAIANAMYHVGGGVLSLDLYPNKATPLGIFVAPGAIGVFLGYLLSNGNNDNTYVLIVLAILVFLFLYLVYKEVKPVLIYSDISPSFYKIIIWILIVIAIRSFVGSSLVIDTGGEWMAKGLLVTSVFLGKFMGGILGDNFGFKRVGVIGLLLSLPLLILGMNFFVLGLIGALLFNFTMAITLFVLIDSLGKYKGFAFGLTTLTLVVFFLPSQFGLDLGTGMLYIVVMIVLITLASYALNNALEIYNDSMEGGRR